MKRDEDSQRGGLNLFGHQAHIRMDNGHSCGAGTCKPAGQVEGQKVNGCGQGCNGGTCEDTKTPRTPVSTETDCSSIYCDPQTAAQRHLSPLERRMCFKCKTSKAEVGCCEDVMKTLMPPLSSPALVSTRAGFGEAAGAFVLGLFSIQLGQDCQAHHTYQVLD